MTVSIVVADDHEVVRAGLVMLLRAEPDFEVVAEAADGQQAVALSQEHHPDVVVMDVRMPGMDGVAATRILADPTGSPDHLTKVLVLTSFDDDQVVLDALRSGASGYLLKAATPRDLVTAVRRVAAGEQWIDSRVAGTVIAALALLPGSSGRPEGVLERLTAREREVLTLMAQGLSNAEISARLVLSEATVKTHVSRVLFKTGSRDRAAAVALAYQGGLVVVRPRPGTAG